MIEYKMKLTDIELLAALENLRIIHANDKPQINDWCFRIASAVVASALGYDNRADWTHKAQEAGLVEYGVFGNIETAKANYKAICAKLDA